MCFSLENELIYCFYFKVREALRVDHSVSSAKIVLETAVSLNTLEKLPITCLVHCMSSSFAFFEFPTDVFLMSVVGILFAVSILTFIMAFVLLIGAYKVSQKYFNFLIEIASPH